MTEAQYGSLFFILAGLLSLAGAYFNWNWYMNNYRARIFVKMFGRGGARIFYGALGAALSGFGIVSLLG